MKNIYTLLLLAFSISSQSYSQTTSDSSGTPKYSGSLSITNQERYLNVGNSKQFIQDNITIKGSVDLNGVVQIYSLIQTGGTFNSGFNNIYDVQNNKFNSSSEIFKLYIKQLYVKKVFMDKHIHLSAGALNATETSGPANAFSSIGWVDGARAQLTTAFGDMTITTGQIKATEANLLKRLDDYTVNYFEINFKKEIFEKLKAELSLSRLNGSNYIATNLQYDLELITGRILHLIGESKINTNNGEFKVSVGLQNILSFFKSNISKINLSINYEYTSAGYNKEMMALSNLMHSGYTGGALVTTIQYPISKRYQINGFTNIRIGNTTSDMRIETGISKTIFDRKFKSKKVRTP